MPDYNIGVNVIPGQSVSPIAGVSTTVSGIMGTFFKGPLNVATLVTSMAEFERIFGDRPAPGSTSYYSVKAFFANVSQAILWVTRIASATAAKASKTFKDQGGSVDTLKVEAAFAGIYGNDLAADIDDYSILSTKPKANISAAATSGQLLSIDGLERGSEIKFYNGTNTEYRRVIDIDSVNGTITWAVGLTYAYTTVNGVITSMEFALKIYLKGLLIETWNGLSMNKAVSFFCEKKVKNSYVKCIDLKTTDVSYQDLPLASSTAQALTGGLDGLSDVTITNYQGSQAAKSGVYAFDAVDGLFRFCCPNPLLTDASPDAAYETLVQSLLDYANNRKIVEYYADVPFGKSMTDAVTFALKFSGKAIVFPHIWGMAIESGLPLYLPPSSAVLGRAVAKDYSRGVHKNIGNEPIAYFTDLEYHVSDPEARVLDGAGLNPLRRITGQGIRIMGGNTRSSVVDYQFVHLAEYWNYVAKSLMNAAQDSVFDVHDNSLWKNLTHRFETFFASELRKGAIWSIDGQPAYRVSMTVQENPSDQVAQGIAVIKAEYVPVGTAKYIVVQLGGPATGLSVTSAA